MVNDSMLLEFVEAKGARGGEKVDR